MKRLTQALFAALIAVTPGVAAAQTAEQAPAPDLTGDWHCVGDSITGLKTVSDWRLMESGQFETVINMIFEDAEGSLSANITTYGRWRQDDRLLSTAIDRVNVNEATSTLEGMTATDVRANMESLADGQFNDDLLTFSGSDAFVFVSDPGIICTPTN